jgi:hypothetical protein
MAQVGKAYAPTLKLLAALIVIAVVVWWFT